MRYIVIFKPFPFLGLHLNAKTMLLSLVTWMLQQLSPDNLHPEIKTFIGNGVGNVAKLAVVVLVEQRMGKVNLSFLM